MQAFFKSARSVNGENDPQRTTSAARVGTAGVLLKASKGRLYNLHVTNHAATAYVLMVFDKSTAPVATDVPVWRRLLPASGEVVLDLGEFGLGCANGIGIAISSTPDTLTLAIANDVNFAAQWK